MHKTKLAIVGSKPCTWHKFDELNRDEWETWQFSRRVWKEPPHADKWFEIHPPRLYDSYERVLPGYTNFIKKNAVLHGDFPFDEIVEEFGPHFLSFGQASWLMAYAIWLKKYKEIALYGIEPPEEYGGQKVEVLHWMAIARERGIKTSAPADPVLVSPRKLYAR